MIVKDIAGQQALETEILHSCREQLLIGPIGVWRASMPPSSSSSLKASAKARTVMGGRVKTPLRNAFPWFPTDRRRSRLKDLAVPLVFSSSSRRAMTTPKPGTLDTLVGAADQEVGAKSVHVHRDSPKLLMASTKKPGRSASRFPRSARWVEHAGGVSQCTTATWVMVLSYGRISRRRVKRGGASSRCPEPLPGCADARAIWDMR